MFIYFILQLESAEDAKLSQILSKQRYHQQQLQTSQHQQSYQPHSAQRSPQQQQWNIPAKLSPQGKAESLVRNADPAVTNRTESS